MFSSDNGGDEPPQPQRFKPPPSHYKGSVDLTFDNSGPPNGGGRGFGRGRQYRTPQDRGVQEAHRQMAADKKMISRAIFQGINDRQATNQAKLTQHYRDRDDAVGRPAKQSRSPSSTSRPGKAQRGLPPGNPLTDAYIRGPLTDAYIRGPPQHGSDQLVFTGTPPEQLHTGQNHSGLATWKMAFAPPPGHGPGGGPQQPVR